MVIFDVLSLSLLPPQSFLFLSYSVPQSSISLHSLFVTSSLWHPSLPALNSHQIASRIPTTSQSTHLPKAALLKHRNPKRQLFRMLPNRPFPLLILSPLPLLMPSDRRPRRLSRSRNQPVIDLQYPLHEGGLLHALQEGGIQHLPVSSWLT